MDKIQILYFKASPQRRQVFEEAPDGNTYAWFTAESAESGLALLQDRDINLVICEDNLPDATAVDILQTIKERHRHLPVIVLSEEGSVPQAVRAVKLGAADFLEGPFDPDALRTSIRNVLAEAQQARDQGEDAHHRERIKELERKAFSLGMANVDMLAIQEKLEEKNQQMEELLASLSRRKDELQAILDTSPSAVVMVNSENRITAANQQVKHYFGLSQKAVLNLNFQDFLSRIKPCFADYQDFWRATEEMKIICRNTRLEQVDVHQLYANAVKIAQPRQREIVPMPVEIDRDTPGQNAQIWVFNDITQMKQADELLHTIMEASPIPFIVSKRKDGTILYANEPLAELVDLTPAELIGKKSIDFYANPEDRKAVLDYLARDGHLRSYELPISKADGSTAWMSFSLVPATLEGEEIIIGGLYDIDERRRAEEALRESEQRFRQLTENIREAFWIYDLKADKALYISPAYDSLTGRSREDIMADFATLLEAVHPEDRQRLQNALTTMKREPHREFDEEYRIIKPDGEIRWIRERAFPIFDDSGEPYRICGVSEDFTYRKQAEAALRKSEQTLRTVFNSVYDAIIIHDENGSVIDVNDKMLQLYGVTREEALQMTVPSSSELPEADPEKLSQRWQKVMEGQPQFFEWIARRPEDGVTFDVEVFLQKIPYGPRDVILANIRDISARKEAEENLLLYRKIFTNSNDPIAILDAGGRILEVNPAAEKVYGSSKTELIGQTTAALVGEKTFNEMLRALPERGTFSLRKEMPITTKAGKTVIVELSAFPILNDEGEIIYRVGFSRDITERKQAQEALQKAHDELELRVEERTAELAEVNQTLRESEARNTALLNAIPDLMFRIDKEGVYIDYNAPKDSDLAKPPEEIVGKSVYETLPPELAEKTMTYLHRTLESNELHTLEYQLTHNDHIHYFEARLVKSGEDETISIVRDITERKLAEQALRQAHEELEMRVEERTAELAAANRDLQATQSQLIQSEKMAALGTLVAGIAHEINTPVGAINSMHNTLVRAVEKLRQTISGQFAEDSPEHRKLGSILKVMADANRVIASGSERVTTIVRRLRSFARLDEAELKEADIHEGLEDTLVLIHHEIKHHIQLEKEYGTLPKISCYPGKLNQVFLNLLINAKQAVREEGKITIKTGHENGKVLISISDNGVGIPPQQLVKIFDPGFTTKGVGVGTGLGLSIVYQIVKEDHRGDITVESIVGQGTTFTVIIPDNLDELVEHT